VRYQFQINRRPGADRALTGPFDGVIDWHLNWQASNQGNGKRAMTAAIDELYASAHLSACVRNQGTPRGLARAC
jgi:hypothetical protein